MVNSLILPWLLSTAFFYDVDRPINNLLDQDFGVGLRPDELMLSRYGYYSPSLRDRLSSNIHFRPLAELLLSERGGISSTDKDSFKISLNVKQFKPDEIEVKVVDKYVIISAKHEEKQDDHGLISRQFVRKLSIPENVDPDTITSTISSDGVLMIQAPIKGKVEDKNERKIKIEFTGQPALKPKKEEEKEEATTTKTTTTTTSTASSNTITE